METIVEKFILQLEAQLSERRVAITLCRRRAWLAKVGYDPVSVHDRLRAVQTHVLTRHDELLFGKPNRGTVVIRPGRKGLTFEYRQRGPAETSH
jgi:ATP-dependent Clp protease ATP-binding subunit ClpA